MEGTRGRKARRGVLHGIFSRRNSIQSSNQHRIEEPQKTVTEIQALLDDEPAGASQHLAVLRMKDLVVGRKEGTSVYYSVPDPLIFDILDAAHELFNNHVTHAQAVLHEEDALIAAASGN